MSDDLFLIAHKVRGEPAFDIAIMLDLVDEDGDIIWIIPTSGHRAYPWWSIDFDGLASGFLHEDIPPMPANLPDHYHLEAAAILARRSLIDQLNLRPSQPPIIRRI